MNKQNHYFGKVGRQLKTFSGISQKGNGCGDEWCILAPRGHTRTTLFVWSLYKCSRDLLLTTTDGLRWKYCPCISSRPKKACLEWAWHRYHIYALSSSSDWLNDILHWWWCVQCEINTRWRWYRGANTYLLLHVAQQALTRLGFCKQIRTFSSKTTIQRFI